MQRTRRNRITFIVLCVVPLAASAGEGLQLKPQRSLLSPKPAEDKGPPIYLDADKVKGQSDQEIEAEGNVRLRRLDETFSADWMRYQPPSEQLDAEGRVRAERGSDVMEGDRLRFNLGTERGFMDKPKFRLSPVPANPVAAGEAELEPADSFANTQAPRPLGLQGRGNADRVIFQGPDRYRMEEGSYTTCGPNTDDWFIRARELDIDKERDVGIARGASIVFFDHTIFYSPYLSFPLHQERKSGFLAPHYGSSTSTGLDLTLPYYWNIAPNMDATLSPRIMTRRGLQLNGEFRYLEPTFKGEARFEYLPDDSAAHKDRYAYFLKHGQGFDGWGMAININRVSDDRYFRDLATHVSLTSRTVLPNEFVLARSGVWGDTGTYAFSALAQTWQTLQTDPLAPVVPPYDRKPQLSFNAFRQVLGGDFDLASSYVDFKHDTLVSGRRAIAYPSFSLPFQSSSAYITPKLGVHVTRYNVDANGQGLESQTRTLPVFTTDSGVTFERDTKLFNMPFTNTLEPRLYYVYIPFKDQSRLPNFDTGVQDVNFATIFSENLFAGQDRIAEANQITLGVTSRLIHPDTGVERLRATLAQRYYFRDQRVTLPNVPPRATNSGTSDLLAAVSGTILPSWTVDAGWEYNADNGRTQRLNVSTRYQPGPGRVLNLAYRNTIDLIRQTDISFQWPVTPSWSVVGRWNWSLQDKQTLEALGGFTYDGGCWAFSVVLHRFATALNATNTSIFMQLELNGVSRVGSNPLDVLRRNVGGYTRVEPRAPLQ
jgi:LPS-assembly protein